MPPSRIQHLPAPNMPPQYNHSAQQYFDEEDSSDAGLPPHLDLVEDEDDDEDAMEDVEGIEEEDEEELGQDDASHLPSPQAPPLPPHLREISSLASWTVSSSKPGCSIPQLRSPSTAQFWQSDGPQPHYLNIHFFKRVSIAGVRLYLDFEADESYTPTKIIFLAGTGYNDLVEWAEMRLEQPRGWCNVDMSGVGRYEYHSDSEFDIATDEDANEDESDAYSSGSDFAAPTNGDDFGFPSLTAARSQTKSHPRRRGRRAPTLRAHLLQIKILENHQNGKDTHLRGLQIFARDKTRRDKPIAPTGASELTIGNSLTPTGAGRSIRPEGLGRGSKKELAVRGRSVILGGLGSWADGPDLR